MKQILTSLFVLFITFSCEIKELPQKDINLSYEMAESFQIIGEVQNYKTAEYEFGIIYKLNPLKEQLENFVITEDIQEEILVLDENNKFSFTLNTENFNVYNYISPFIVRGFAKDTEGNIFYSNKTTNLSLYNIALNSNSTYAEEIVNKVQNKTTINQDFIIKAEIDSLNQGFNVDVNFQEFNENNIYGLFYKYNALSSEQDELTILCDGIIYYANQGIESKNLKLSFSNLTKEQYFDELSFRAFLYNADEDTITFSNQTKTVTLYELALNDDSEFGKQVVEVAEENFIVINQIVIYTDVNKEYEVSSYSEGIIVKMKYDYIDITLTVNILEGYRFSKDLTKEDIIIHIVADNKVVDKFSLQISAKQIIIVYDDHGWGPPM